MKGCQKKRFWEISPGCTYAEHAYVLFRIKTLGKKMCMDAKISGEFLRSFLYFCHSSVCTAKMPLAYDNVSIISNHSLYLHKKIQAA